LYYNKLFSDEKTTKQQVNDDMNNNQVGTFFILVNDSKEFTDEASPAKHV
jgi:hypothetical protein